jgi:hypothetical protein
MMELVYKAQKPVTEPQRTRGKSIYEPRRSNMPLTTSALFIVYFNLYPTQTEWNMHLKSVEKTKQDKLKTEVANLRSLAIPPKKEILDPVTEWVGSAPNYFELDRLVSHVEKIFNDSDPVYFAIQVSI